MSLDVIGLMYRALATLLLNPVHGEAELNKVRAPLLSLGTVELDDDLRRLWRELVDILQLGYPGDEEEYISLFELSPKVPLYLSHYYSDDPQSKIFFMLYLKNLYRFSGLIQVHGELPDYLPLILEYLGLTWNRGHRGMRSHFISHYLLPLITNLREKLDAYSLKYTRVIDLALGLMKYELRFSEEVVRSG